VFNKSDLVLSALVILRLSVKHFKCFGRSLVVAIHFFNKCLKHVKVELVKQASKTTNLFNVLLVVQTVLAVFTNEYLVKTLEVKQIEDTTRAITHVRVNPPLVIHSEDVKLLAAEHAVKQCKNLFLFFTVIDLFKLVKQHSTGLVNVLQQLEEAVTSPRTIDNNRRNTLLSKFGTDVLSKKCLTTTLFTVQQNTSLCGTVPETIDDTIRVTKRITIHLSRNFKSINLLKVEIAHHILSDSVVACWKLLMEIHCFLAGNTKTSTVLQKVCHIILKTLVG